MAGYIGNKQKISGRYTVDEFTSSGGTTYTLTKAPGAKNNIQVSAGGLTQYPSAYSVSGTTLTLTGVPSGQKVVVRHMGDTIPYPLLADDAVTESKIATNAVTTGKIAAGAVGTTDIANDAVTGAKLNPALVAGDVIYADGTDTINRLAKGTAAQVLTMNAGATAPEWAAAGGGGNAGANGTSCHKTSATASIVTATWTKCTWEVENYDVAGDMDIATNERFTVPSGGAGKYLVHAQIAMWGNDQKYVNTGIYIDGSLSKQGTQSNSGGNSMDAPVTHVFELADGAYIEIFVRHNKGSNSSTESDSARNHLSIIRID